MDEQRRQEIENEERERLRIREQIELEKLAELENLKAREKAEQKQIITKGCLSYLFLSAALGLFLFLIGEILR